MVVRFFLEPSEQSVILSEKRTTARKGGLIIGIVSYPVTLLFLIGILSCSCIANNSYNRHITTKKLSDPYLYFSFQFTKIFLQKSMQTMTTTGMRKAILWRTAFKSGVPESSMPSSRSPDEPPVSEISWSWIRSTCDLDSLIIWQAPRKPDDSSQSGALK